MLEYSPRRRTALVLTGSGASGAYHAGVLRALDESGVKIDLVVGSGAGTVAAALGAAAAGEKLYGEGGLWDEAEWATFYRLRAPARVAVLLLSIAFGVFLLPLALALLAGILFPLLLIVDLAVPGLPAQGIALLAAAPALLRAPYLAALSAPVFMLCVLALLYLARHYARDRRRFGEAFESLFDPLPGHRRVARVLWEVCRGPAVTGKVPPDAELGARYVATLTENENQPGFRELILRAGDLDSGRALPFVVLSEARRATFFQLRRGRKGEPLAVDLRAKGYEALFLDAVLTGLLPPLAAPVRRVAFPRGGLFAGEVHRLTDATAVAGCGIGDALAAGAEQVIVATAVPESEAPLPRRRGPRALLDGLLATLERQAVEVDAATAERINRLVETLGHRTEDGGRAWQDPATGRQFRSFALYLIRPERRALGPLELDGGQDPGTEVVETPEDLLEQGYRDAYRLFVEPVVGAAPEPARAAAAAGRAMEL